MATSIGLLGGSNPSTPNTNGASSSSNGMPTENTFLQLLVAQMKYQDPTNPTDSTQFVSQLAQFSQLEQVMGIKSDIEAYHTAAVAGATAGAAQTDNSTNGTTQTSS